MALESDLARYYNGRVVDFSGYELDLTYSTGFQKMVWRVVRKIPYGKTLTYREVAEALGMPKAARAVGNALNENPTPILIPCHRVVGSRDIGGFRGGSALKKRLLKLEGVL
ncbi:MAG: methylated-DNA--[protein]-cysteine S-methyltransferase [Candidatus Altiarchaeales archaeon]|nr:methylated-DNA--[protein]-cysteine S-methyltransferase [Candidatus Altiarchaeales archaeon]MBD3416922.1 methylated-DNA--[protein]-cysteine S-methyltransferase [Candidatus Altiarchaeales archaeon]